MTLNKKMFLIAILALVQTLCIAQSDERFSIVVLQGKDTLNLADGLKNYESLRVFWVNKTNEKLKAIEVHFGNGQLPFSRKSYNIGKGQKMIVVDLQEFLALDNRDKDSPRKREAEVSRIVIFCQLESPNKYASFAIPFKVPE